MTPLKEAYLAMIERELAWLRWVMYGEVPKGME